MCEQRRSDLVFASRFGFTANSGNNRVPLLRTVYARLKSCVTDMATVLAHLSYKGKAAATDDCTCIGGFFYANSDQAGKADSGFKNQPDLRNKRVVPTKGMTNVQTAGRSRSGTFIEYRPD